MGGAGLDDPILQWKQKVWLRKLKPLAWGYTAGQGQTGFRQDPRL